MKSEHSHSRSRRRWLIAGGILALAVLATVALIAYRSRSGTTTEDVEALIKSHLSSGATTDEIFGFLDSNRIQHTSLEKASGYSQLIDAGYRPETTVIAATIRDTGNQPIGRTDIEVYFILGPDDRLVNYVVEETDISL